MQRGKTGCRPIFAPDQDQRARRYFDLIIYKGKTISDDGQAGGNIKDRFAACCLFELLNARVFQDLLVFSCSFRRRDGPDSRCRCIRLMLAIGKLPVL